MALSIGFGNSISLLPAIQATRLLTFASVGLSPTEHACLSWSHFRTAGFPRYGFKAGRSGRAFPATQPSRRSVCLRPSCSPLPSSDSRSVSGTWRAETLPFERLLPLYPRGPRSLRSGFFCPGPFTLNRPHPPHSQAQSRFHRFCGLYQMPSLCPLRLGDLRVVPSTMFVINLSSIHKIHN
jgi:hypothetical protein